MATKAEIKKAILAVAGDPESGVIADLAEKFADAVFALDSVATEQKDNRTLKAAEVR